MIPISTSISISTYKEAENIVKITDKIRIQFPLIKILIIDDKSDDNTKKLIEDKKDKNIIFIQFMLLINQF